MKKNGGVYVEDAETPLTFPGWLGREREREGEELGVKIKSVEVEDMGDSSWISIYQKHHRHSTPGGPRVD